MNEPLSDRWQQVVDTVSSGPMPAGGRKLKPGYRLGEYMLLMRLAQGGMASVWVALRRRNGQRELVAIKTILSHLLGDRGFVKMFLDEVALLTAIHHPNVVEVRDVGTDLGQPFVALEWIDGDSLSTLLAELKKRDERLPLAITLRIIGECCLGLHTAHELRRENGELANVIHRDVSPANIVLSTTGDVKLIDFGVAKAAMRLSEQTRTGVFKGKIAYMAPEQVLKHPADRRTDIWSVGCVLYQLLAGRTPYKGHIGEVYQKLKEGDPIAELPSDVPRQVGKIALKALARDPEERFSSAADMRRAVQYAAASVCEPLSKSQFADYVNEHLGEQLNQRRALLLDAMAEHPI